MKKVITITLLLIISVSIFVLGFDNENIKTPNNFYQVYIDDEAIGVVNSREELEEYINKQGSKYKKDYGANVVYAPNNMEIVKLTTYHDEVLTISDIYKRIMERSPFTIEAFKVTIKVKETSEETNFYVANKEILQESFKNVITTYVGVERYNAYVNNEQDKILTTGRLIEDAYIENEITTKNEKVPVNQKIYTDTQELTEFLIFGKEKVTKTYTVKSGDNISDIALDNEISSGELLISNKSIKSENSLLFPGQQLSITATNPKVNVVLKEYVVEDVVKKYTTEETIDENRLEGDDERVQEGKSGLDRVAWSVITVNGDEFSTDKKAKEEITPSVNEIWIRGGKVIPNVGSLKTWTWPTESGYRITRSYGWRINPLTHEREFHQAVDISGTGYGSNIYAANNGTIEKVAYQANGYGNYIVINHNNGYRSIYGHLSAVTIKAGQTVARGQIIGKMGTSGLSTGTHLHFEVWKGTLSSMGSKINPLGLY